MGTPEQSEFAQMAQEYRTLATSAENQQEEEKEESGAKKETIDQSKGHGATKKAIGQPNGSAKHKHEKGSRVSAKTGDWKSYYKGVITNLNNDGTYKITFDDGEKKKNVKEEEIKFEKPGQEFKVGDRIEAKVDGWDKFYGGFVKKVAGPGSYKCEFDDGDVLLFCPWDLMRPSSSEPEVNAGDQDLPVQQDVPATVSKFQIGDRVAAKIDEWPDFFKGVVAKQGDTPDQYTINFDDGDVVTVAEAQMRTEDQAHDIYAPGDRIEAKLEAWDKFYGGKVAKVAGRGSYTCDFDDGEHVEFVPFDRMRKGKPKPFPKGTRVMAKIPSWKEYYAGTVISANRDGTHQIEFDDGDIQEGVKDVKEIKQEAPKEQGPATNAQFKKGDKVLGKIPGWGQYFPGTVNTVNPDGSYAIAFDDGEVQEAVKDVKRQTSADTSTFKKGDRILGKIPEWDQYYPGTVKKDNGDGSYKVIFDDGDRQDAVNDVKPVQRAQPSGGPSLAKGAKVMAKVSDWDQYYPGTIKAVNPDGTYKILFDDGDKQNGVTDVKVMEQIQSSKTTLQKGTKVLGKIDGWDQYYQGTVECANADGSYKILFDDGEVQESVKDVKLVEQQQEKTRELPSSSFAKGTKVLGKIDGWDQYYQGTIENANADGSYKILFDDGEVQESVKDVKLVEQQQEKTRELPSSSFAKGTKVLGKIDGWDQYYQGTVECANADGSYKILFDDGEVQESVQDVKLVEQQQEKTREIPSSSFSKGTKVLGKIDGWDQYYQGTIENANADGSYKILFDDGEVQESVKDVKTPVQEKPKEEEKPKPMNAFPNGTAVMAKIEGWGEYYPGSVQGMNEDGSYIILFDDSELQTKVTDLKKVESSDVQPVLALFSGDRVEAKLKGWKQFYLGIIDTVNGDGTFKVQFDDGEMADRVPPSRIKLHLSSLPFAVDDRVEAKLVVWDKYYKGKIVSVAGRGTYRIVFEDGEDIAFVPWDVIRKDNSTKVEEPDFSGTNTGDEDIGTMFGKFYGNGDESVPVPDEFDTVATGDEDIGTMFGKADGGDEDIPVETEQLIQQHQPQKALPENQRGFLVFDCRVRGLLKAKTVRSDGKTDAKRVVKVLQKYSKDGTTVNLEQFTRFLGALGVHGTNANLVKQLITKINGKPSTSTTIQNVESYAKEAGGNPLENKLRALVSNGSDLAKAFRAFDMDGSGAISVEELCKVFQNVIGEDIGQEMAESIIRQFDENGDMQLDEKEFVRFAIPQFSLYVLTPLGQFGLSVDPTMTIAKLKTLIQKRGGVILGPEAMNIFSGRASRIRLARHMGKLFLEPPYCNSSMACYEVLSHGEQIFVSFDKEFKYVATQAGAVAAGEITSLRTERRSTMESKPASSKAVPEPTKPTSQSPANVAHDRLKSIFEFLDKDGSGFLTENELLYGLKHRPQVRNMLRGSPALQRLLENPSKVLSSLDQDNDGKVTFDELAKLVIPVRRKSSSSGKNKKGTALWDKLKKQAEAAKAFVDNYKDSGAPEMSEKLEETIGRDQANKLSQEARARMMTDKGVPVDMKNDKIYETNAQGEKLKGQDPVETQQWVNAMSSDRWLGLKLKDRKRREEQNYATSIGLPVNPTDWSPADVKAWLLKKLELSCYADYFQSMTGKSLLSIYDEQDLIAIGLEDRYSRPMVGLHRKKILAHIDQLRELKRLERKKPKKGGVKPEDWAVCDVIEWLVNDMKVPTKLALNFKMKSIDGCVLHSLTNEDLQTLVGIEDEKMRKTIIAGVRRLFGSFRMPTNNNNSIKNEKLLSLPPTETTNTASTVDSLIMDEINQTLTSMSPKCLKKDTKIPSGSGRAAVKALKDRSELGQLREVTSGAIEELLRPSTAETVLKAGDTSQDCFKLIESALYSKGLRKGEMIINSWFDDGSDEISKQELWHHVKALFPTAHLAQAPFSRMWRDIFNKEDDDLVEKALVFKLFLRTNYPLKPKRLPSRQRIFDYLNVLNEAITKVRMLDQQRFDQAKVQREISRIASKIQASKQQLQSQDLEEEPRLVETIDRLEQEWDLVLLGKM